MIPSNLLSVTFDSFVPTHLALRANLRLLYLESATILGCGSILKQRLVKRDVVFSIYLIRELRLRPISNFALKSRHQLLVTRHFFWLPQTSPNIWFITEFHG